MEKSFLVLFFKKEHAYFPLSVPTWNNWQIKMPAGAARRSGWLTA
jgi:hypothetical protein